MSGGVIAASSGMKAQMEALDVLAHNLANMNTVGFKEQKSFFNVLKDTIDPASVSSPGLFSENGIEVNGALNMSAGLLQGTQRDLDIALVGDGFLTVGTPRGIRYTRNGALSVNSRSELSSADGSPVLGEKGPILVGAGKLNISVEGEVFLDGARVDRLKIADFDNSRSLVREGSSMLLPPGPDVKPKAGKAEVRQGYLEQSNVNTVGSMVEMIGIMRKFESIQKSLNILVNDLDSKSIEKLGR